MNSSYGKLSPDGEVNFVRNLPGPVERVWLFLADAEKRARWFAGGKLELRAGGRGELFFHHANISPEEKPPAKLQQHHDPGTRMPCEVTRCQPLRVIAFTWPGETPEQTSEVSFELTPMRDQVRLALIHRGIARNRDELAVTSAGWHTHLDILDAVLNDTSPPPIWATASKYETEYFLIVAEAFGQKPPPVARLTRHLSALAERVFDAWLDPARLRQWMTGAGAMKDLQRVNIDARVGGGFSLVDRRGGKDVDHVGKYLEIDRPRRLKFTWGIAGNSVDRSTVTLNLVPTADGGCELTLIHELDPAWADQVDRIQDGWAKLVDGLAASVEHPVAA